MSHTSAVEYWEKYALHAFENANSAVYSTCILLSPTKQLVPCTFCFTIKRDIFDLPSIIIGNVRIKKKPLFIILLIFFCYIHVVFAYPKLAFSQLFKYFYPQFFII